MLRTLTDKEKEAWRDHLPQVIHAYNSTRHEFTGYSPHFLLFGCHPCLPVDLLFGEAEQTDPVSHKGYAEKWWKRMTEANRVAKPVIECRGQIILHSVDRNMSSTEASG